MKIKKITKIERFIVETDDSDFPIYIRYGDNCWANQMGDSEEMIYEFDELEELFIEYIDSLN
jgi:hypothetical protein